MPGQAPEHVLPGGPAERRRVDLTRKRVHDLANELVAARELDAQHPVDEARLAPEPLADAAAQALGIGTVDEHDVAADLTLQRLGGSHRDERATVHETDAAAAFRLFHAVRR